jgi:hypothetical protein
VLFLSCLTIRVGVRHVAGKVYNIRRWKLSHIALYSHTSSEVNLPYSYSYIYLRRSSLTHLHPALIQTTHLSILTHPISHEVVSRASGLKVRRLKLRDAELESRHFQAFSFCFLCVPFALETSDRTIGERFVDQHLTQCSAC